MAFDIENWTSWPGYLAYLKDVRLLVLGSYKNGGYKILSEVTNGLIKAGIANSRLVADFDPEAEKKQFDPETYELSKSEYWIERADLLLFDFIAGLDNGGIAMELAYAIERDMMHRAIVAYNERDGKTVSSLIKQRVKRYSSLVTEIRYSNETELVDQVKGSVVSKLEMLYERLRFRTPEEWETGSNTRSEDTA